MSIATGVTAGILLSVFRTNPQITVLFQGIVTLAFRLPASVGLLRQGLLHATLQAPVFVP